MGRKRLKGHFESQGVQSIEPLLPYAPRAHVGRIMAGLALAPALPNLAGSKAISNRGLAIDHLRHGGSLGTLRDTGLTTSPTNLATWGAVTGAVIVTLLTVTVFRDVEPAPAPNATANTASTFPAEPRYIGIGAFTTDEWGGDPSEHHIFVHEVFPDTPAQRAGLQRGDRVTHVGGRRVNPEGHPFQTHWLHGELRDTLEVTLERPQANGSPETLTVNITLDWIPSHYLQKAKVTYKNRREGPGIVMPGDRSKSLNPRE